MDLRRVWRIVTRLPRKRYELPPALRIARVNDADLSDRRQGAWLRFVRPRDQRPHVDTAAKMIMSHRCRQNRLRNIQQQAMAMQLYDSAELVYCLN